MNLHGCGNITATVGRHKLDSGREYSVTTLSVQTRDGGRMEISFFDCEFDIIVEKECDYGG